MGDCQDTFVLSAVEREAKSVICEDFVEVISGAVMFIPQTTVNDTLKHITGELARIRAATLRQVHVLFLDNPGRWATPA